MLRNQFENHFCISLIGIMYYAAARAHLNSSNLSYFVESQWDVLEYETRSLILYS